MSAVARCIASSVPSGVGSGAVIGGVGRRAAPPGCRWASRDGAVTAGLARDERLVEPRSVRCCTEQFAPRAYHGPGRSASAPSAPPGDSGSVALSGPQSQRPSWRHGVMTVQPRRAHWGGA
jgi:hypothetical protein